MYASYNELTVWQKAMDMVVEVYQLTREFPHEEQFAMTNQLRRAAVSVPSNIAEGHGRDSKKEFSKFLRIANGSAQEVSTQMTIALRLGYLTTEQFDHCEDLIREVRRMLFSLRKSLNDDNA